jgi:hypothetical protein
MLTRLEERKMEISHMNDKLRSLERKQANYDNTLSAVSRNWDQVCKCEDNIETKKNFS